MTCCPAVRPPDRHVALGAVALVAAVTWLQTRVDLHLHRAGGRTDYDLRIAKHPTDPATVHTLAELAAEH
ncbi:hypothetical protein [Kitasatospora cheerisanensis]|uniref:hypothetical protein n=1 Tax=Kitasatospora cheerisanensis TaxID=81942 RepID=UPI0005609F0B|nr:hypothetical protein [Kitasatospora cheerisanensis]